MAQVCKYMVTYVPAGCTSYESGQIVTGDCEGGSCQDLYVDGGACDGAYFTPMSCACEDE